jgi:hypothetical protein
MMDISSISKLSELVKDKDGSYSHSKLWANVASGTACYVMAQNPTVEMVGLVLGALVLKQSISKGIDTYRELSVQNQSQGGQNV